MSHAVPIKTEPTSDLKDKDDQNDKHEASTSIIHVKQEPVESLTAAAAALPTAAVGCAHAYDLDTKTGTETVVKISPSQESSSSSSAAAAAPRPTIAPTRNYPLAGLALPLTPAIMRKLHDKGYLMTMDILYTPVSTIARDCGISIFDARAIVALINSISPHDSQASTRTPSSQGMLVLDMIMQQEEKHQAGMTSSDLDDPIITLVNPLDDMMRGLPRRQITEICGEPATCKSIMCLQVACAASIPIRLGGAESECLFLDTTGTIFNYTSRLISLAESVLRTTHETFDQDDDIEMKKELEGMSVEKILKSIHIHRIHNWVELMATLIQAPSMMQKNPKLRIIIIDSITSPFRCGFEDVNTRSNVIMRASQLLNGIVKQGNAAVLVTNEMTSPSQPMLGIPWSQSITNRIHVTPYVEYTLHRHKQHLHKRRHIIPSPPTPIVVYHAHLDRSPYHLMSDVYYRCDEMGIIALTPEEKQIAEKYHRRTIRAQCRARGLEVEDESDESEHEEEEEEQEPEPQPEEVEEEEPEAEEQQQEQEPAEEKEMMEEVA